MALVDLRSNLSWYSSNGNPPGYKPNADKNSTNFVNNEDLSVSATPRGFDNAGAAATFPARTSLNQFYINSGNSFQGTATRKDSLGQGTIFPSGPDGTVFTFDRTRTGFNITRKYSEVYNSLSNAGLADTYVIRKPINAMYNKFKVRDQVYNPYGDPAPPFILRGIQKDDSIFPERYGDNSIRNVPRGGPKTAEERAELDVDRISKFMLRPPGQWFIEKQNQLHLMNPNREGVNGLPQDPSFNANSPKVFDIQNLLNQVGKGYKGERDRKHGQFPYDTPGFLPFPPSPPSNYEDIHKERALGITHSGQVVSPTLNNRLVIMRREALFDDGFIDGIVIGGAFSAIANLTYDGKVSNTPFKRFLSSIPVGAAKIPMGDKFGRSTTVDFTNIRGSLYTYFFPYYTRGITLNVKGVRFRAEGDIKDAEGPFKFHPGLERRYITLLEDSNLRWKAHQNDRDGIPDPDDTDQRPIDGQYVKPDAFSIIKASNDIRNTRGSARSTFTDFRAYENAKGFKHEPGTEFKIDTNTGNKAAEGGREEALLTRLGEDRDSGQRHDGIGISPRTLAEPNRPNELSPVNPFDGTSSPKTTEDEYRDIGQAAEDRTAERFSSERNAIIDFRPDKSGNKYQKYQGTDETDENDVKREQTKKYRDYPAKETGRNRPEPEVNKPELLQTYKRLTYTQIRDITTDRQANTSAVIDFTTGQQIDNALNRYISQVNSKIPDDENDFISFKFNSIIFKGYIDSISDNFTPGYSSESDQNRADPRYLYTSFERSVSITFRVVWEQHDASPWENLKRLADLSLPKYGGGPFAQRVDVTIGGLYTKIPMLIESLSYDWDNETPWALPDINTKRPTDKPGTRLTTVDRGKEVPLYTSVTLSLKYMGNKKPDAGTGYVLYGTGASK